MTLEYGIDVYWSVVSHECDDVDIRYKGGGERIFECVSCGCTWGTPVFAEETDTEEPNPNFKAPEGLIDVGQIDEDLEDHIYRVLVASGMSEKETSLLTITEGIDRYNQLMIESAVKMGTLSSTVLPDN